MWGTPEEENDEERAPAAPSGEEPGRSATPTPTPADTAPTEADDDEDVEEPLDAGIAIELEPDSPEKRRVEEEEEEEDEEEEPEVFAKYLVHTPAAGSTRKRPISPSATPASG